MSALHNGVGTATHWSLAKLRESGFYLQYESLTSQSRGLGYWAWKPWIILKLLDGIGGSGPVVMPKKGDILIYSDAGVEFINNVSHIIELMDQDIFLFGNNWEHAHWCKRDIVEAVWPWWERGRMLNMDGDQDVFVFSRFHKDNREQHWINVRRLAWERFHKQCQASVIFFRVSDYSRAFVKEWLDWCLFEGGRLIDDSPSRAPNHPEFRENRHDQAILTTLAYREGIKLHAWPAVYNRFLGQEFVYSREGYPESDNYPALFHHHRFRNSDFEVNKNGSMDT
jgi:hypothetical protein